MDSEVLRDLACLMLDTELKIFRSSAYKRQGLFNRGGRSFMKRINRSGSRTEPWGTPEVGKRALIKSH